MMSATCVINTLSIIVTLAAPGGHVVVFKIRRIKDGKFSTGGSVPMFTPNGKTWSEKNLKLHLSLVNDERYGNKPYHGCEIVKYYCEELRTFDPFLYPANPNFSFE
jgi:hypothetical protein